MCTSLDEAIEWFAVGDNVAASEYAIVIVRATSTLAMTSIGASGNPPSLREARDAAHNAPGIAPPPRATRRGAFRISPFTACQFGCVLVDTG